MSDGYGGRRRNMSYHYELLDIMSGMIQKSEDFIKFKEGIETEKFSSLSDEENGNLIYFLKGVYLSGPPLELPDETRDMLKKAANYCYIDYGASFM